MISTGRRRSMPASRDRLLERFAFFMHFFDEIEQHDDMADDDADQARDAQERHEAERRSHDRQAEQRADNSIGSRGEYQQRLYRVAELQQQRRINSHNRNHQNCRQICESRLLLGLLAADLHAIAASA